MSMILISNSKHVIIDSTLLIIKNQTEVRQITAKRKKFIIPEMLSGKYTFITKIFFLRPSGIDNHLQFKYKLGMHKGEQILHFREREQKLKYLDSCLDYVSSDYLQLSLENSFEKEDVVIKRAGECYKRILLRPSEMQKIIVEKKDLKNFKICYEIKGMLL
jgi:hypothetical protein